MLCLLMTGGLPAAAGETPQVWFNLTGYNTLNGVDGPEGWKKLFGDPEAPWPAFMNHVQVVAATGIMQVPDDVLTKAMARLNRNHVKFAIESPAQNWVRERACGRSVEGYFDPPGARKVAEKIKAAGGQLAYVVMDEPLFYGHAYNGRDACRSSIDNTAERAAAIMKEYKRIFPHVAFGDIEPVPALSERPDWENDYRNWMAAFNAALGRPIAFLQIAVNWRQGEWPDGLSQVVGFTRSAGLPVGIVYDAEMASGITTDRQWLDAATANIGRIERQMGIVPDQAVFRSWDKFPERSITDSAGPGEDDLVKRYLKRHGAE